MSESGTGIRLGVFVPYDRIQTVRAHLYATEKTCLVT
jgi:hypothetical protein